jgi:hypothetical protein
VNTIVRRVLLRLSVVGLLSAAALGLPVFGGVAHAGPIPGYCVGLDDSGLGSGSVCTP